MKYLPNNQLSEIQTLGIYQSSYPGMNHVLITITGLLRNTEYLP
jgi:hypothetical protein